MYTKTCTYKLTYKGVLKLDTIPYNDVLILKKGSMEVNSSIVALDLTLQRGAISSISEEALSFSYEHFLGSHTYYHATHELLSGVSPISHAIHLKDQDLFHHKVDCIYFHNTHNVNVVTIVQIWTGRICFRGCSNELTNINILLCTVMAS